MSLNKISSLLAAALALSVSSILAQPVSEKLWQIGRPDGSESEFALYGRPYSDVSKVFPGSTAIYRVGESSSLDVPFVIPGPQDSWAGNPQGSILVNFGVKNATGRETLRLTIDFVEVHPSAPVLKVALNDFAVEVKAPAGTDQNYLDHGRTRSKGLSLSADIPAGVLKTGDNTLMISSISGSWMVLDCIRLESSGKHELSKAGIGVSLLSATSEPALVYGKDKNEVLHPVTLKIVNWGKKTKTVAWMCSEADAEGTLEVVPGINSFEVGIPEGYAGRKVSLSVKDGKNIRQLPVEIKPADKWTVYLVQHTHTDIGYTKPQTEILTEHLRYIDYAIEYCEATEDYPDDAKFRWTCEASWAVREWLRIRPKEQADKFLHYVKNGQIEVTAMFFNMSELSGENNYKTFFQPVSRFKELGIPVVTAMQNDVNGLAWCLADYLPDLGVKYVTMGSNGHRADIPFDRPTLYKWESPSGKSLLSFRADHYNTGNYWGIERGDMDGVKKGVFSYITTLKRRGYDFPLIAAQYSGYFTDNSPPSMQECRLIREWNDHYAWPKLRSATAHEFLERIDKEYSDRLPVFRAAYPDWWTDGFGSAARETSASRKTQSDMIVVEGMLSMANMSGDSYAVAAKDELRRIHENLLFYDEHTFGAAESIRNPLCENSQVQWAEKGSYVWEALKSAQMMYETAIGRLQGNLYRSEKPTITFFNTLGIRRSALMRVYIDFELVPKDKKFNIVDEAGNILALQPIRSRNEGRYYDIWVEDVPAFGYKTFEIVVGNEPAVWPDRQGFSDSVVENEWYKVTFDTSKGGIVSLIDKTSQKELIDSESEWRLGSFVYETLKGDRNQMERKVFENYSRTDMRDVRFTGISRGDIYTSVFYEGKSDGCEESYGVQVEVRLHNKSKRIDLCYSTRRLPETDPSGLYVAFPFEVEKGRLAFDVPGGTVYAGENQIPRTAAGWNTVQNFVSARNDKEQIVLSCDAVPLFMMGELLDDPYRLVHKHEKQHVFSWVMNNYWTTNFRASQEGELNWSYTLTSETGTSNSLATEFGWGNRIPLYARVIPGASSCNGKPRTVSFIKNSSDNLFMASFEPSAEEEAAVLVNIREVNGKETVLELKDKDGNLLELTKVNILDEPLEERVTSLKVLPYENIFVRVSR